MATRFRIAQVELVTGPAWMVLDRRLESFLEDRFPTPAAAREAIAERFGQGAALSAGVREERPTP